MAGSYMLKKRENLNKYFPLVFRKCLKFDSSIKNYVQNIKLYSTFNTLMKVKYMARSNLFIHRQG